MFTIPFIFLIGINIISLGFTGVMAYLYKDAKKGYPLPESRQTKLFGWIHFRGSMHVYVLFSVILSVLSFVVYFTIMGMGSVPTSTNFTF